MISSLPGPLLTMVIGNPICSSMNSTYFLQFSGSSSKLRIPRISHFQPGSFFSTGFAFSSSLSNTDVPYIRQSAGLPELPISWTLFDLPYFTFAFDPPIPPGSARSAGMDQVLDNWLCELTGTRRWGALFSLQLDPQATGEQGRLFMLERVLDEIQKAGDVWLATGTELAAWTQKMQ